MSTLIIARLVLVGALAAPLGAADDLVARLRPHLASHEPDEVAAALQVCAAAPSPALAEAALAAIGPETRLDSEALAALAKTLATLPRSRLLEMLVREDLTGRAAAEALGSLPFTELAVVLAPSYQAGPAAAAGADRAIGAAFAARQRTGSWDEPGRGELARLSLRSAVPQQRAAALEQMPWELLKQLAAEIAKDVAPEVRLVVARRVGDLVANVPVTGMRELLVVLAADTDLGVRREALVSLAEACSDASEADPVAKARERAVAERAFQDADFSCRRSACLLAGRLGDPRLLELVEGCLADDELAPTALDVLLPLRQPKLGDHALRLVESPTAWTRLKALRTLVALRHPRLGEIARRLSAERGQDSMVRLEALEVLSADVGIEGSAVVAAGTVVPGEKVRDRLETLLALEPAQRAGELSKIYDALPAAERPAFLRTLAPRAHSESIAIFICQRIGDSDPAVAVAALESVRPASGFGLIEAMTRVSDRNDAVASAAMRRIQMSYMPSLASQAQVRWAQRSGAPTGQSWHDSTATLPAAIAQLKTFTGARRVAVLSLMDGKVWDQPEAWPVLCEQLMAGDTVPQGAPRGEVAVDRLIAMSLAAPAVRKPILLRILGRCPHPKAVAALREAARERDRAVRWAARDGLVQQGVDDDEVLDHALARLLTTQDRDTRVWPVANAKLRARLAALASLADPVAVAEVGEEIDRRMSLPAKPSLDVAVAPAMPVHAGDADLAQAAAGASAVALERRVWRGEPFNGSWNRADCTRTAIDAKPALRIAVRAGDKDLGAAETDVRVAGRPLLVRLRVRNESKRPFPIMIGLRTGDLYHECKPIDLAADGAFHDVEVDLARSDFKCAASGWQHSAKLAEPEYLNLITVVLLCGKAGGAVMVQGVDVIEEKP